jgi:hypothetical protein
MTPRRGQLRQLVDGPPSRKAIDHARAMCGLSCSGARQVTLKAIDESARANQEIDFQAVLSGGSNRPIRFFTQQRR